MEDEYLKIICPKGGSRLSDFYNAIPEQKGILYCIEYYSYIAYGISIGGRSMAYHRLNGPAIVYKTTEYIDKPDEYWVYSKLLGFTINMTFEEFKIRRDKLLKEMVFK